MTQQSRGRRALAGLAGVAIGLSLAVVGAPPALADGTLAIEFDPLDYPVCTDDDVSRNLSYMVNRVKASAPVSAWADGNGDDEDGRLYQQPTVEQRDDFRAGL